MLAASLGAYTGSSIHYWATTACQHLCAAGSLQPTVKALLCCPTLCIWWWGEKNKEKKGK